LIVENRTANILLAFNSKAIQSYIDLDKASGTKRAKMKQKAPPEDGHTSQDQDSVSDRNVTSGHEGDEYEIEQSPLSGSSKRTYEGLPIEGKPLRRNDSIHFGSISDMSLLSTRETERVVKRLRKGVSEGDGTSDESGGVSDVGSVDKNRNSSPSPLSREGALTLHATKYTSASQGKKNVSIIDELRHQVQAEFKEWSKTGTHQNGNRSNLNSLERSMTLKGPQMRGKSGGQMSQHIKKERNRLHAKLTRDRKKVFTSKMVEMIAYIERQNKKRREILVQMGVETVGADRVSLRRSLIFSEEVKEEKGGKEGREGEAQIHTDPESSIM
jgi:hypothetical protein